MVKVMSVEPCDVEVIGDVVRHSAVITGHPGRKLRRRNGKIFFDVPAEWQDERTSAVCHDAFLRAVVFSAMEAGRPLIVRGAISAKLLENLETYQEMIHGWWPRFRPVEIRAEQTLASQARTNAQQPSKAILGFTGGLDSAYTLYSHRMNLDREAQREIAACVFVHGFDISLGDGAFAGAFSRIKNMTDELGVPLIPVRTNVRQRLPSWNFSHPGPLAAVLSLFESKFDQGLIAGSHTSPDIKPQVAQAGFGSTSWSDPLLSSCRFEVIYDGDKPRVEKCADLRGFPTVWKNVRVCFRGKDLTTNCGRCCKCIWQLLDMRAAGIDDFSGFQSEFKITTLKRYGWHNLAAYVSGLASYQYVEQLGREQEEEFRVLKGLLEQASAGRHTLRQRWNLTVNRLFERIG